MAGGRPSNSWTSSRKRRLIRLYTLTTLTLKEITNLLREEGFNPCLRDVQGKLKSLFSIDYNQEFRKYRPSGSSHMRLRLKRIRQLKRSVKSTPSLTVEAFRTYASTVDLISPLSPISPDSQPTTSSKLLLDGSTVMSKVPPNVSTMVHSFFDTENEAHDVSPNLRGSLIAPGTLERSSGTSCIRRSINSLGKALAHRYSPGYLDFLRSVLRSSTASSWRSSKSSVKSAVRSFRGSIFTKSSPSNVSRLGYDTGMGIITIVEQEPLTPIALTSGEQSIWDILVNETELGPSSQKFFAFGLPDISRRICCHESSEPLAASYTLACRVCGNTRAHWQASVKDHGDCQTLPEAFLNQKDHFGNTPLHCAMGSSWLEDTGDRLERVLKMVKRGANCRATNTFGQTFLHVLTTSRIMTSRESILFFDLIHTISALGFSFDHRDRYGRTIMHTLLQSSCLPFQLPSDLDRFAQLSPDAFDIFGQDFYRVVSSYLTDMASKYTLKPCDLLQARKLIWSYRSSSPKIDEYIRRPTNPPAEFIAFIRKRGPMWVDANGDSCLHTLIKLWYPHYGEAELSTSIFELAIAGADVNMRDRNGNTPLVLSAIRGYRPSVKVLLEIGASPHCRNFDRQGILKQVYEARQNAKKSGNDELYARIMSCSMLLADAGAKACLHSSEWDEWIL